MRLSVHHSFSVLVLLFTLQFSTAGLAVPLTDEQIKGATNILVMPGSYDPMTLAHVHVAEVALQQAKGTLLIMVPTAEPLHKQTLPFRARVDLMHSALSTTQQFAYPSEGAWFQLASNANSLDQSFYQRIKELNPDAKLSLVIGQDVAEKTFSMIASLKLWDEIWVAPRAEASENETVKLSPFLARKNTHILNHQETGASSSKVRQFLQDNMDLYFGLGEEPRVQQLRQNLEAMVPKGVAQSILSRGLYIGRNASNQITPFEIVKKWFKRTMVSALERLGLYMNFKHIAIQILKKSDLKEVTVNGKTYPIKKYLGSGLSADAYLINIEGQEVAIKIARTEKARASILESIPVQMWAQHKYGIAGPRLVDYDPEGRWVMAEFVRGQNVKSYIMENGTLTDELRVSLEGMHAKALRMAKDNFVALDFAPDNLIIKDGIPALVDFGPIPLDTRLSGESEQVIRGWERKLGGAPKPNSPTKASAAPKSAVGAMNSCEALF